MDIAGMRDIIIIIYGIIGIIVLIIVAVLGIMLYRRAQTILNNVQSTSESVKEMVANIKEKFVDPATQFMAMIMGIKQMVALVGKLFKKGQEKEEEEGC
jgi:L-asparagine transporter-like permease